MSYEYERSVTYDFKKYKENKQIEFSANTKTQLDNYYCLIKDTIHPVLLYIDGKSYKVTEDVLNTQLLNDNLVLVIRDRSDLARKQGLSMMLGSF